MNTLIIAQASDLPAGAVGGVDAVALIVGLLTGIAFGILLQRVGASSFEMIVNMLRLKDLTIMKFLFLAIAVGSVGMYTLDAFTTAHIAIAPTYLGGLIVGGIIFGIGWAVCGYCPGTCLVAAGEGKVDAYITILGGLTGAITLALVWDYIEPVLVEPLNYGSVSLADKLGAAGNPLLVAASLAAVIVVVVILLDRRKGDTGVSPGEHPSATTM